MSYEILYRSRFIKTTKGLIPLLEMGSNNCWEAGNKKRARSFELWRTTRTPLQPFTTADDLIKSVEEIRAYELERNPDEYKDSAWSYYTCLNLYGKSTTTYTNFLNYFKRAIRDAKTIEEWAAVGVHFTKRLTYAGRKKGLSYVYDPIRTESDIVITDDYTIDSSGDVRKPFRNYSTEARTQHGYWRVKVPLGYLQKNTKRGYTYSYTGGKEFKTQAAANTAARGREGFSVEYVDQELRYYVKVYA